MIITTPLNFHDHYRSALVLSRLWIVINVDLNRYESIATNKLK